MYIVRVYLYIKVHMYVYIAIDATASSCTFAHYRAMYMRIYVYDAVCIYIYIHINTIHCFVYIMGQAHLCYSHLCQTTPVVRRVQVCLSKRMLVMID